MSKAVYAKLWASTSQYHLRRAYGWTHVIKRLAPWGCVLGLFGVWLYFPAMNESTKKLVTFGVWKPVDVGYMRSKPLPYE